MSSLENERIKALFEELSHKLCDELYSLNLENSKLESIYYQYYEIDGCKGVEEFFRIAYLTVIKLVNDETILNIKEREKRLSTVAAALIDLSQKTPNRFDGLSQSLFNTILVSCAQQLHH